MEKTTQDEESPANSAQNKVISGIKWSFFDQFGIYAIKLIFSIAIARALAPEDYGLMGLITIFIAMGTQLTDSGFQMALIQRPTHSDIDSNTVFLFNLGMSILVVFCLFIGAPQIAHFFNEPRLIPIVRVASLNIVIGALSGVHLVMLMKKLDFKTQATVNLPATFISSTIGLILAYSGFHYWALVIQTLSGTALRTIQLWIRTSWKPAFAFSFQAWKEMFNFGSKILLGGFLYTFFANIYSPIIGKNYSIKNLGFYEKATSFSNLYTIQTSIAISRVAFPAFSNIQGDKNMMKSSYASSISLLTVFFFLVTLCILPLIEPVILLLLTEKWMQIVPFLKLLVLDALFFPAYLLNIKILEAQGKSGSSLALDIMKKGIMIIGLLITVHISIEAIIYSILISSFLGLVISWFFIKEFFAINNQLKLFLTNGVIIASVFTIHQFNQTFFTNTWALAILNVLISVIISALIIMFSTMESHKIARLFLYNMLKIKQK